MAWSLLAKRRGGDLAQQRARLLAVGRGRALEQVQSRRGRAQVAFAKQFVAAAPGLEITGARDDKWRGKLSLRWVLTHMVEEYARHIGHADLIRERIDGAVGQ